MIPTDLAPQPQHLRACTSNRSWHTTKGISNLLIQKCLNAPKENLEFITNNVKCKDGSVSSYWIVLIEILNLMSSNILRDTTEGRHNCSRLTLATIDDATGSEISSKQTYVSTMEI